MIISTSLKKKKNNNRLVKNVMKKNHLKKTTKDDLTEFNEWLDEKETGINSDLFWKHFSFQRPSDMLKALCTTNNRKKNIDSVNMIKRGLSDLNNEIENMSEEEK